MLGAACARHRQTLSIRIVGRVLTDCFQANVLIQREFHGLGVSGFITRLGFEAIGPACSVHPKLHWNTLRNRAALGLASQRQQPPRFRIQRAPMKKIR